MFHQHSPAVLAGAALLGADLQLRRAARSGDGEQLGALRLVHLLTGDGVAQRLLLSDRGHRVELAAVRRLLGDRLVQVGQHGGSQGRRRGLQRLVEVAALQRGVVLRVQQRVEHRDVGLEGGVAGAGRDVGAERDERRDDAFVVLDDRDGRGLRRGRRLADVRQVADAGQHAVLQVEDRLRAVTAAVDHRLRGGRDLAHGHVGRVPVGRHAGPHRRGSGRRPACGDVARGGVPLVGELSDPGDHEGVQVRQGLDALERLVVVHRADDLDHAEDQGGDGRHRDDRDKPPAHAPVADRQRRALAHGRRGLARRRHAVTAGRRYRDRQAHSRPRLGGVASRAGTRAALAKADGQRSALRRPSASVERKTGSRRLRTTVSVGHRTSTHCAYTSQLQGQPGQAQGNSSS